MNKEEQAGKKQVSQENGTPVKPVKRTRIVRRKQRDLGIFKVSDNAEFASMIMTKFGDNEQRKFEGNGVTVEIFGEKTMEGLSFTIETPHNPIIAKARITVVQDGVWSDKLIFKSVDGKSTFELTHSIYSFAVSQICETLTDFMA